MRFAGAVCDLNCISRLFTIRGKPRQALHLRVELNHSNPVLGRQGIEKAPGCLLKLLTKVHGRPGYVQQKHQAEWCIRRFEVKDRLLHTVFINGEVIL